MHLEQTEYSTEHRHTPHAATVYHQANYSSRLLKRKAFECDINGDA
jgi:hypothetical protein